MTQSAKELDLESSPRPRGRLKKEEAGATRYDDAEPGEEEEEE